MKPRILVVDDDDGIRALYLTELVRAGYEVAAVDSGGAAVALASREKFAIIILDIEMPDMSGIEALSHLRRVSPDTPVILNTAYSNYKQDFQSWLADAYVLKSSDLEPLKHNIRKLIDPVEHQDQK
ncbi:MAG: response regulator [candidate division Zixibacteria bacterium]|nr:response regulator [candidate division Zixibacteria bacterium]MDH3936534.1 response regulator [candidate division Zixibacteria bacterium]MDH4035022.1 response regulator [candidate division Zixibacteria bacterium]